MTFKNLISNLNNEKTIKAVSKPIPKKIINCIGDASLTASEIASKISFPKEKIYYHIKKLVSLNILFVSEKDEIKGIVQKKYKLSIDKNFDERIQDIKTENIHNKNVNHLNEKVNSTINQYDTFSKYNYAKAVAGKFLGVGNTNDLTIQSYQLNSKIKKLKKLTIDIENKLLLVEEKKKTIITEISIYDNSELLHDSLQKKIEENDELDKQIKMHNDYILSLKEKITIIEKNYNDEKSKKNIILKSLLEKINNIEKDVLLKSNKKDQIEAYIKNIYDKDTIYKKYQDFDFNSDIADLKIQKKKINKDIGLLHSQIGIYDEKVIKNEKAIELLSSQAITCDNELNHLEHNQNLFRPVSQKVLSNNIILQSNLENDLKRLEKEKSILTINSSSLNDQISSSIKQRKAISNAMKPLSKELDKNKQKNDKLNKEKALLFSEVQSLEKNILINSNKLNDKTDELVTRINEVQSEVQKIKSNNTSKKLESKLVFRNSLIDSRNSFQNDLKILKEKQYKEIDLFEKSYKILEKEKKKNVTRKDHFINKIKNCEESITSLSSEIDSFSDLLNLNNSIYNCLKIFKNKLFDLDLSAKIIDNNNNDRSHEVKLDGYIKTFNWSIDDLKKKRNIYDDFEKKINDNNQNIFKELEEIKQITNSLISFPEKLNEYRSSLIETRLSFEEFNSHIKAHDRLKDDIKILREKKTFYKKSNINRNQEMKALSNDLKKVLSGKNKIEKDIEKAEKKIEGDIVKLKSNELHKNEMEFSYNENLKNIEKSIIEVETKITVLKDLLNDSNSYQNELDKKIKIFDRLVSKIDKENDIVLSLRHKIDLNSLNIEKFTEEKTKSIEDIRSEIAGYEDDIIKNKTWISNSRFEEKQILAEIRIWKKEINRLNAEQKLLINEIKKVKENNSLKESKLNLERDKKIQKILKEENNVVKEDTIKLKKINQLYLETDSKFSIEESKILTTLNIQEKNLKDIEKKLNKVNKSIQLFNSKNERKLNRVQRAIDSQKSFKEKMNTKLIVENQKLTLVKSEKEELESTIKDKILDSGLKVQEYENKIKFKSSTSYFSFMKQTLDGTDANDINDNQIAEIINKSVLNDQKTIESLRKELFNDRKDLRKKVESKKISISKIRGKISNLKNQIHDHNKNIKKENRIFDKLIAPNKKLEIEKNQILKEKDVMEKSYIQFQNSEQEKLDQLMAKRKRLKKQHEDNVIGHKAIFESKLNEFKNRIKNHEDLRSLKINQSSRDLNRFLEKADKRLGQIEQLINTGEEVIKELILKIEELTKKRKASSSSIQFSDKKIYVLDNRLEKTKANITSKVRLYRKELEIFNLKIEESSLKKLDLDKEKEALALVLKSFEKKIINIGRDPSQIEYDIEQNEKLLNQLKQDDRLKLKREDAIKKNNLMQQNKDINDNLALQRKNLISLKKSLSETLTRINILEKDQVEIKKEEKISNYEKLKIEKLFLEKNKLFEDVEDKVQAAKNNFKYNFTKSKKIARPLNVDYKLLISSSEKVRDSEKLFESFLKVLIDDRQSIINKLETFRIEDNKLNKVISGMKNELFELEKNYNNEINKIISNENDSKAELNNISNNLKLVDGELFDIKSFKKSEKQQLKLLKERKLNLQNQKNEIKSLYQNEVSTFEKILDGKITDQFKVDSDLERTNQRIRSIEESLMPRISEFEKIENFTSNANADYENLIIELDNISPRIEECKKGIRKVKKQIKGDNKRIENEKKNNTEKISNLKINLEQISTSTKNQRIDLEKNIRIKSELNEELNEAIQKEKELLSGIKSLKEKISSASDLKKLLSEHKILDQEVSTLTLKLNQFHENFSSLKSAMIELKEITNDKVEPIEKELTKKEFELLRYKDNVRQNNVSINDYESRIRQSPHKLKSLNKKYLEQNRMKFQLELQLKDNLRNIELLDKKVSVFLS